jgi:SAM-dependent methyltransferase
LRTPLALAMLVAMEYDPVKERMARLFLRWGWSRRLLFFLARQIFLREQEVRAELRRLAREGFRPRRILDAGTGYGQYALYLHRLFPEAELLTVDIKPGCVEAMADLVSRGGLRGIHCEVADLTRLEREAEFDLILNVDVMEHIEDDLDVFRRFRRALAPGGRLLLHTPAVPEDWPVERIEHGRHSVGEHVREGYSHALITGRLREAGFTDVAIRPTYGTVGGLAWRLGVRWPMAWLSAAPWSLPLVLCWLLLVILPVRLLNGLERRLPKARGGCLLLQARAEARP